LTFFFRNCIFRTWMKLSRSFTKRAFKIIVFAFCSLEFCEIGQWRPPSLSDCCSSYSKRDEWEPAWYVTLAQVADAPSNKSEAASRQSNCWISNAWILTASLHPCVRTMFTTYIEMHKGRLEVRNEANQR